MGQTKHLKKNKMNTKDKSIEELKRFYAEVAQAIWFLMNACVHKEGDRKLLKTDKPFVMHSLTMAFKLLEQGYDKEVILGAILHDLLEDAQVEIQTIKEKFGDKVARIVKACSFDESIEDKKERYKELFNRVKKEGREALIVKASDILDNSNYFHFVENPRVQEQLLEKWSYFLDVAKDVSDEPIFQELVNRINLLTQKQN